MRKAKGEAGNKCWPFVSFTFFFFGGDFLFLSFSLFGYDSGR
jgi:hypothetical protein